METLRNIFEDIVGKSTHNSRWQAMRSRLESADLTVANRKEEQNQKRSRIRDPATTCKGLVALMTYDPINSTWTPKKCSRGCLPNSQYCKTHGKNTQHIICQQCTEHHGQEVRHTFLHEHFGITDQPSYHFNHPQFRDKIIKQSQKEKKTTTTNTNPDNNINYSDNNTNNKKIKKQRKQRYSDSPIVPNAFMSWLKVNRAQIKAEIQTQNPNMSAKDLMVSTTKQAGILWKLLDKSEQEKWKSTNTNQTSVSHKDNNNDNDNNNNDNDNDIIQIIPNNNSDSVPTSCNTEPETPIAIEQDDDESVVLTFNETHRVWFEDATGLYYKDNNPDQPPMGQIVAGKLVPFKKTTRTLASKRA
jgi:hypothetical protein